MLEKILDLHGIEKLKNEQKKCIKGGGDGPPGPGGKCFPDPSSPGCQ